MGIFLDAIEDMINVHGFGFKFNELTMSDRDTLIAAYMEENPSLDFITESQKPEEIYFLCTVVQNLRDDDSSNLAASIKSLARNYYTILVGVRYNEAVGVLQKEWTEWLRTTGGE